MSLASNYNAVFTITRNVRAGDDDGTPTYTQADHDVAGWFDEAESMGRMDEPFRDQSIPYSDRRALFMCDAGADVLHDDAGVVVIGGVNRGRWEVAIIRTAPVPGGVAHLEVQLQGAKESK